MPACRWYLARNPNPYAEAVEPGSAGVNVPDAVLNWITAQRTCDDPNVYLLVGTGELPVEISGLVASMGGKVSDTDAARVTAQLEGLEAERRGGSGPSSGIPGSCC